MVANILALAVLVGLLGTSTAARRGLAQDAVASAAGSDWRLFNKYSGCKQLEDIVEPLVKAAVEADPLITAGLLRLAFHDCAVNGCDGSTLKEGPGRSTEKYSGFNTGLVGIELIDEIKAVVDAQCGGVVSCADILQLATRDATVAVGGPTWKLRYGRLDGVKSTVAAANAWLPSARANVFQGGLASPGRNATLSLAQFFEMYGLNVREMVALSGSHTVGKARCATFSERLAGLTGHPNPMDPALRTYLNATCAPGSNTKALMDIDAIPPNPLQLFDNSYFKGLQLARGVLNSDQTLFSSPETRNLVDLYADKQNIFFRDFARAMVKMSEITPFSLQPTTFGPALPVYPYNTYSVAAGSCQ